MATLTRRWQAFWFPAVPLERLAIFRVAVSVFAFLDVVVASRYLLGYPSVAPVFFDPVYLLAGFSLMGLDVHPVLPTGAFSALFGLLLTSLAAAAIGWRTRIALAVAAPLYLYFWAVFNSWGKINHGKIPVVFALFVLAVAPAGARLGRDALRRRRRVVATEADADPLAGWALRVVGVVVVASYLLSVYAKLDNTGPSWPLQPVLAMHLRDAGGTLATLLSRQRELLVVLQSVTLLAEALAFLAFTKGRSRNVVLAVLGSFHVVSFVLIGTEFFGFVVCYLVFFDTEVGLRRLEQRWPGLSTTIRGRRPSAEVPV
ncbi:HTTM domain-containing protein [Egicoccus halophilus]|uniref:HTTM-like domain-containing protein n=1 Tax=Egicoccus halophilus TaxID=1670830 RepID=A0A8J3ETI2_9ACTN|nr:hypothetical protein [Egicoccus halophilus]GGI09676.1 hypothetical protein GCM10011354_35260 [Egicoccus halophilus]